MQRWMQASYIAGKIINHLMYKDDMNLFCKKWKKIRNPNTNTEDIHSRYKVRNQYYH